MRKLALAITILVEFTIPPSEETNPEGVEGL